MNETCAKAVDTHSDVVADETPDAWIRVHGCHGEDSLSDEGVLKETLAPVTYCTRKNLVTL